MGLAASEVARRKRDNADIPIHFWCEFAAATAHISMNRVLRTGFSIEWPLAMRIGTAGLGVLKGGRGGWKFRQAEIIRDGTEVEGRPTGDMENIMALCHGPRPPTALAWVARWWDSWLGGL